MRHSIGFGLAGMPLGLTWEVICDLAKIFALGFTSIPNQANFNKCNRKMASKRRIVSPTGIGFSFKGSSKKLVSNNVNSQRGHEVGT